MPVLRNVEVRWANVIKPDTNFNAEGEWNIVCVLNDAQAQQIIADAKAVHPKGVKIKEDNGEKTYKFKRSVMRKSSDGAKNNPPFLCGPGGKNDIWDNTKLIGNGSICNIQYGFVPYENKFGKGATSDLKGVQVVEHVPYGTSDGDEFDSVEPEVNEVRGRNDSFNDDDFS